MKFRIYVLLVVFVIMSAALATGPKTVSLEIPAGGSNSDIKIKILRNVSVVCDARLDLSPEATTTTIITTTSTTTTTLNVPCESLTPPSCFGKCPSGEICVVDSGACKCVVTTTTTSTTTTTTVPTKKFKLVFIPINENFAGLNSAAEQVKNNWVAATPLRNCPDNVEAIVVDTICYLSGTPAQVLDGLLRCAVDSGHGDYTRVVGVAPGLAGSRGISCIYCKSAAVEYDYLTSYTSVHELGHTFGLCDEGYGSMRTPSYPSGLCSCGGIRCSCSCPFCCPNSPEYNSIMCSTDYCGYGCSLGSGFGSTSYTHLESELNPYCS